MKKKFLIAGGGTGGHIYPGIAIAKAIEEINSNIEVEFVGSNLGLEKKIVPREGFKLHLLSAGKINFKGSVLSKIGGVLKSLVGVFQSILLIYKTKPVGVLGVGGYASAPLVFAATLFQVPTSIWEPNAFPGMANRILSHFVKRAFVVFEATKKHLKSKEVVIVGLPVRKELENLSRARGFQGELNVLCFGGSQGAKALNTVLEESVKKESDWLHKAKLIHQTGDTDYQRINESYKQSVFDVKAFEYLFEMEKYYSWASVAICRAGASTIAELAAVGIPAILIPLPTSADDHQRKNAEVVASQGAALLVEQKNFSVDLLNETLINLQNNPETLEIISEKINKLHKPYAAKEIATKLLKG